MKTLTVTEALVIQTTHGGSIGDIQRRFHAGKDCRTSTQKACGRLKRKVVNHYAIDGNQLKIVTALSGTTDYLLVHTSRPKFEVAQEILHYAENVGGPGWLEESIQNIHDFNPEIEFHINRLIANPEAKA